MLNENQLKEIREHLEKAQNPLFYFDDDQDGLCSFLILRRFLGRGKGIPVKSNPLDLNYFRRVQEFEPDYLFILDKPDVSSEFFKEVEKINLPVVWIDHHNNENVKVPFFVEYYNSFSKESSYGEPVTYLSYMVSQRKEDLWIAVIGCISDKYLPDFYSEFLEKYPELGKKSSDPFDIYFDSNIGKIAFMLGSGLKDRTTNVMRMIKFLINVKAPHDLFEEVPGNSTMRKKFSEADFKFRSFIKKANQQDEGGKIFLFKYSSNESMTSILANYFSYKFPKRVIVIARLKESESVLSIRGEKARELVLKIVKKIEGSRGGGHEKAVGAVIPLNKLDSFLKLLKKLVYDKI